jgi:uncharacterized protein (DUF1810 family)
MSDPYNLKRFVLAQDPVYARVLEELRTGRKRSHYMWFIFPQYAGLGRSDMAQTYAITSLDEALAYLAHPVLGERLRECSRLMADIDGRSAHAILGDPDYMKFHSSMTLFARVASSESPFRECLVKYFGGVPDAATLSLIK